LTEVHGIFRRATDAEISWHDFEAALHEWHESAVALRSEALSAAFAAPTGEVPLTQPALTVEDGADVCGAVNRSPKRGADRNRSSALDGGR
jgi:hypothetical protein